MDQCSDSNHICCEKKQDPAICLTLMSYGRLAGRLAGWMADETATGQFQNFKNTLKISFHCI